MLHNLTQLSINASDFSFASRVLRHHWRSRIGVGVLLVEAIAPDTEYRAFPDDVVDHLVEYASAAHRADRADLRDAVVDVFIEGLQRAESDRVFMALWYGLLHSDLVFTDPMWSSPWRWKQLDEIAQKNAAPKPAIGSLLRSAIEQWRLGDPPDFWGDGPVGLVLTLLEDATDDTEAEIMQIGWDLLLLLFPDAMEDPWKGHRFIYRASTNRFSATFARRPVGHRGRLGQRRSGNACSCPEVAGGRRDRSRLVTRLPAIPTPV